MNTKEHENNIKTNGKSMEKNIPAEKNESEKSEKKNGIPDVQELQSEKLQSDLHAQLTEAQVKHHEINDKYLRLYSDFDNFRKRTAKERIELIKYAGEELISLLLPVIDDFERALKSNENLENKAISNGIQLIYQKFKNILSQQGLKEMEIGDGGFNPELHDAISKVDCQDKEQKGKIIEVLEKGYCLNDKVIRHAKVVVGS